MTSDIDPREERRYRRDLVRPLNARESIIKEIYEIKKSENGERKLEEFLRTLVRRSTCEVTNYLYFSEDGAISRLPTAVFVAVKHDDIYTLQLIAECTTIDVDKRSLNTISVTALFHVESVQVLNFLLNIGFDLEARITAPLGCRMCNWTPFLRFCEETTTKPNIIKALIKAGCDVNAATEEEWTAFHLVGNAAIIQILVNAGCDKDARTISGQTVLMTAVYNHYFGCRLKVVEMLFRLGCNPMDVDEKGRTALFYVTSGDYIKSGDSIRSLLANPAKKRLLDMIKLLIRNGLKASHRDNEGHTALHYTNSAFHDICAYLAEVEKSELKSLS